MENYYFLTCRVVRKNSTVKSQRYHGTLRCSLSLSKLSWQPACSYFHRVPVNWGEHLMDDINAGVPHLFLSENAAKMRRTLKWVTSMLVSCSYFWSKNTRKIRRTLNKWMHSMLVCYIYFFSKTSMLEVQKIVLLQNA